MLWSRKELGLAFQFLTGHCHLMRHRWIIDGETDPACRLCLEEPETPEHLFYNCPWVNDERDTKRLQLPTMTNWNTKQLQWILRRRYVEEMMDPDLERQRRLEEEAEEAETNRTDGQYEDTIDSNQTVDSNPTTTHADQES